MTAIGQNQTMADSPKGVFSRLELDEQNELHRLSLLTGQYIVLNSHDTMCGGPGECDDMVSASCNGCIWERLSSPCGLVYLGINYQAT